MWRSIFVIVSMACLMSCDFDPDSCNSPFFDGGAAFGQSTNKQGVMKFTDISIGLESRTIGELSDVDVFINYPETMVLRRISDYAVSSYPARVVSRDIKFVISDTATKGVKQAYFRWADSIKKRNEKGAHIYIEPTAKIGGPVTVLIRTRFKQITKCDSSGVDNAGGFDGIYQKEIILNEDKRTHSEWKLVSQ